MGEPVHKLTALCAMCSSLHKHSENALRQLMTKPKICSKVSQLLLIITTNGSNNKLISSHFHHWEQQFIQGTLCLKLQASVEKWRKDSHCPLPSCLEFMGDAAKTWKKVLRSNYKNLEWCRNQILETLGNWSGLRARWICKRREIIKKTCFRICNNCSLHMYKSGRDTTQKTCHCDYSKNWFYHVLEVFCIIEGLCMLCQSNSKRHKFDSSV